MTWGYKMDSTIHRVQHGHFAKGVSANPGGNLGKGQKRVREYAVNHLDEILGKLRDIYLDEGYPIETRVKIMLTLLGRAAGKLEEAPVGTGEVESVDHLKGAQVLDALAYAMRQVEKPKA